MTGRINYSVPITLRVMTLCEGYFAALPRWVQCNSDPNRIPSTQAARHDASVAGDLPASARQGKLTVDAFPVEPWCIDASQTNPPRRSYP